MVLVKVVGSLSSSSSPSSLAVSRGQALLDRTKRKMISPSHLFQAFSSSARSAYVCDLPRQDSVVDGNRSLYNTTTETEWLVSQGSVATHPYEGISIEFYTITVTLHYEPSLPSPTGHSQSQVVNTNQRTLSPIGVRLTNSTKNPTHFTEKS